MEELEVAELEAAKDGGGDVVHDLKSLLGSEGRSFLVRSNGDEVEISSIEGRLVALYFSASSSVPCRSFTHKLVEAHNELYSRADGFEVVFVSADEDEKAFSASHSKMPWLAIPFSDKVKRGHLDDMFVGEGSKGIPCLVLLDRSGKVYCRDAIKILKEHGLDAYPFTPNRLKELKEQEEIVRKEQTIRSVLVTSSRDFLISNNGDKVPVSNLEGKILGLYFSVGSYPPCKEFTALLVEMYEKLKHKGEGFEIVLISLDYNEESFGANFAGMPWLAVPFGDAKCQDLIKYFELCDVPTLVVIGSDGKTLQTNVVEVIENHGADAYPFTIEKFKELEEKEKAEADAQTLESLLVSVELDYVLGKDGNKVPVSELVGKNVLLYFSARSCAYHNFTQKFVRAYHKIKDKENGAFEAIFVSSDNNQGAFDEFYAGMPWLALPFGDERKKALDRTFKNPVIPSVVVLGPDGRMVTKDARTLIEERGANAYPFTDERMRELRKKGWPEKMKHTVHEHELKLARRPSYSCDCCNRLKGGWSFYCQECDFDLCHECAFNLPDEA